MIKINNIVQSTFDKYIIKTNYVFPVCSTIKINLSENNQDLFNIKRSNITYLHYDDPMHSQK